MATGSEEGINIIYGILYAAGADVEVAERVDGREVGWVGVNDFAVLVNGRRDLALKHILLGAAQNLRLV